MTQLKALLLTLLTLSALANSQAQNKPVTIGIEAAPSVRFLFGNVIVNDRIQPTLGFSAGVSYQASISNHFSIRSALAFERKGGYDQTLAIDANGFPIGSIHHFLNFDYLTVPVLLRATFGNGIQYFIDAGPFGGFLLRQATVSFGPNTPRTSITEISRFNRLDVGISGGIGFSVPIQPQLSLSIEIRNNLGLADISNFPVINDGTVQTNSTQVLFGLNWHLGSER